MQFPGNQLTEGADVVAVESSDCSVLVVSRASVVCASADAVVVVIIVEEVMVEDSVEDIIVEDSADEGDEP